MVASPSCASTANEKLVVELTQAARGFFDDLETHAVVLAGAPNAFSAGFDLKAADSWPSETDDLKRRQRAYGGVRLCKAWETMPQITIAAMEKMAVGGGVAIALACDWRVLARDAYLYVLPVLPQPANTERATVLHGDGIGLFGLLSLDRLPFEEAIDRQDAPPLAISLPKRRECPDGLAFGVGRLAATLPGPRTNTG